MGKYLEVRGIQYMDNSGYFTMKISVNYILRRELGWPVSTAMGYGPDGQI
jgi:hypothetical protein